MNQKPTRDKIIKSSPKTKSHQVYKVKDGTRVPGGSTLARLVSFGSVDGLINWALKLKEEGIDFKEAREESATLGTCFHRVVECRHTGETFESEFYPPAYVEQAEKMADSFFEELRKNQLVIVESELEHVHEGLRFGGTMDLVLAREDRPAHPSVLADLKSVSGSTFIPKEHFLQVAGFYRELFIDLYGYAPDDVILFRANRDNGTCMTYVIPPEKVDVSANMVPAIRELYELRRELERK